MPLINFKVVLELKLEKRCVLASASTENNNADCNDIIFTVKDTKLHVPVVTLSPEGNQKLSKLLCKKVSFNCAASSVC